MMKPDLLVIMFVYLVLACELQSCAKPPPLTPPLEAGDAAPVDPSVDQCQVGCAALAAAGCTLGDGGTDCAAFLRVLDEAGKDRNLATGRPLTCADVAAVHSRADAVRIGFVCP